MQPASEGQQCRLVLSDWPILQGPCFARLRSNREWRNKSAREQRVADKGKWRNRYADAIEYGLHCHGVAIKHDFTGMTDRR